MLHDELSFEKLSALLERRIPEWMDQENVVGLSIALVQGATHAGARQRCRLSRRVASLSRANPRTGLLGPGLGDTANGL
jgi:hypothetical protein